MPVAGNFRISNKFLSTSVINFRILDQNYSRHLHTNHPNHHQLSRYFETTSQDAVKTKVAIITGGLKGLGYQIADQLLRSETQKVILADQNLKELENTASKLNEKYGECRALFYPIDFRKKGDMLKLFKYTKKKFKKLDIVINNAANSLEPNNLQDKVNGVVQGTFLGFQEMFGNGGIILNTTAILENKSIHNLQAFNQINNFIIGFTKNMSRNYFYKPTNVKVMAVCPLSNDGDKSLSTEKEKNGQSSITFGEAILTALKKSENGSIWISEAGNIYKMHPARQIDPEPKEIIFEKPSSDSFICGCKKKKQKKRNPMKPKSKNYTRKKDPCAKYKKKRKKKKKKCKKKKKKC